MAVALAPTADPTARALGMFKDASRWRLPDGKSTVVPGVPCFDEHSEQDERKTITDAAGKEVPNPNFGKVVRQFDANKLQVIASNCNRRYQTTGDACPVTLGHTRPGEPEKNQPEICGYALNFRLGRYGPSQRLAIIADFYILPAYWVEFLKHPRRSVELFPRDQVFDPIAVLKRTPERDLGLITDYAGTDGASTTPAIQHAAAFRQVVRYQRSAGLSGESIRYSFSEHDGVPAMDEQKAAEEFAKKVIACVPHMRNRAKKYEAATGQKIGTDGEVSLKDQYQARRFYKGYYLKNSAKIRNAKKMYEAEDQAEKDDEADQFAAEDELTPSEEATADAYYRHFSKHKGIRYAMGMDDEAKAEETPAPPAPAAAAPPPAAPTPPAAPVAGGEPPATAPEMSSATEHKLQPPDQPLDDKHSFTEDQYCRHRYHKDPVFKHMYDKASADLAATGAPPAAPAAAPPAAAPPAQQFTAPPPAAPAAPSSGNASIPPGPEKPEQHAKLGGDAIHFSRQLQAVEGRLSAVETENQRLRNERDQSRGELYVVALEGEGKDFGSRRSQKVDQFAKLDEAKRQELAQEIRETWGANGAPVAARPVHIGIYADAEAVAAVNSRGTAERFSKEDAAEAGRIAQADPEYGMSQDATDAAYQRAVDAVKAKKAAKKTA